MKRRILTKKFFAHPAPVVAQELLGKYLVRKIGNEEVALKIVETEAYEGAEDLASHASKGRTSRTEVMFGEAGIFYIYLICGMYELLNIVTSKKDHPSAVLIRGLDGVSGPGRLTKKMSIDRTLKGKAAVPETGLWFEDRGEKISPTLIKTTPRIGVDYAGPVWSKKEYRFVLKLM